MPERWLPIPGWESEYEVSDLGRVRSLDRWIKCRDGRVLFFRGTILSPGLSRNGKTYYGVVLRRNTARFNKQVHRLVLEAFVGPCPDGMEACHGPRGRLDNRLVNLRWDTHAANIADCIRDGTDNNGERAWQAKLTNEQADWIRSLIDDERSSDSRVRLVDGWTQQKVADKLGVTGSNISAVLRGKSWKQGGRTIA